MLDGRSDMFTRYALLCLVVVAACGGTISRPEETPSPLIGGVTDNGDPSVVLVFAQQNGSSSGSLCTASVISPTVLLTAAHCVAAEEVGSNVTFSVFVGTDWNSSSGPAFMDLGGVETIVGVTSFGYQGCTGGGYDTRVDLYTSFIDQYVGGGSTAPPPPPPPSCQYNCADYSFGAGQCYQGWTCDA